MNVGRKYWINPRVSETEKEVAMANQAKLELPYIF